MTRFTLPGCVSLAVSVKVSVLQGYPPAEDTTLVSSEPEAYKAAKEKVEKLKADQYHEHQRDDHRPKRITVVSGLSGRPL